MRGSGIARGSKIMRDSEIAREFDATSGSDLGGDLDFGKFLVFEGDLDFGMFLAFESLRWTRYPNLTRRDDLPFVRDVPFFASKNLPKHNLSGRESSAVPRTHSGGHR